MRQTTVAPATIAEAFPHGVALMLGNRPELHVDEIEAMHA